MGDILVKRIQCYEVKHCVRLGEKLGAGIHGVVFVVEDNLKPGRSAVKIHQYEVAYQRECAAYQRLTEREVFRIQGCNVPQLLGWDDETYAVEMSIVTRPFVLDFAGAYLDTPPEFPENVWDDWEKEKIEQFGRDWPAAKTILAELRLYGIFMLDVSPSNIAFRDT